MLVAGPRFLNLQSTFLTETGFDKNEWEDELSCDVSVNVQFVVG